MNGPGRPAGSSLLRTVACAGLVGAATGLRSTTGPTAVAWMLGRHPDRPVASLLTRPSVRAVGLVAAAGEFLADKSSWVPSRLSPSGLAPRLLLGALSGAALSGDREAGSWSPLAVVGASAALVAAYLGTTWRTAEGRPLTDSTAAVAEDSVAIALACGACAASRAR